MSKDNSMNFNILTIVGIVGVVGAFLPFYSVDLFFSKIEISTYNILDGLYSLLSMGSSLGRLGMPIPTNFSSAPQMSPEDFFMILTGLYIIFGPLYFAFKSLRLTYYSFNKRKYKWPLSLPIVYYFMYLIYPLLSAAIGQQSQNMQVKSPFSSLSNASSGIVSEYLSAFSGADISFWLYMVVVIVFVRINKEIKESDRVTFVDAKAPAADQDNLFEIEENEIQKKLDDLLAQNKLDYFDEFNVAIKITNYITEVKNLLKDSKPDLQTFLAVLRDKVKNDEVLDKVFRNLDDTTCDQHFKKILLECNRKDKSKMVLIIVNYYNNHFRQRKTNKTDLS